MWGLTALCYAVGVAVLMMAFSVMLVAITVKHTHGLDCCLDAPLPC